MAKERPRVRAAAIILKDDQILLARHEKDGRSYWVLPGGGVDFGETVAEALTREMREEANLEIRLGELIMLNDSIPPDRHRHILNLYFLAEITGGKLRVGQNDKRLRGMQFTDVDDIPNIPLYPDVRRQLYNGIRNGFATTGLYLGNLWKDMPDVPDNGE
jgi:ADP-ribose pyrophosphatase YjhB (NUDIX family)